MIPGTVSATRRCNIFVKPDAGANISVTPYCSLSMALLEVRIFSASEWSSLHAVPVRERTRGGPSP